MYAQGPIMPTAVLLQDVSSGSLSFIGWRLHHHYQGPVYKHWPPAAPKLDLCVSCPQLREA